MSKLETNTIDTISGSTNLTLGGTNATDITIPSGVTLTNNGTQTGLTLSDNILFNTASKGIYLGVTTATASNLLDDYEEGTFSAGNPTGSTGGTITFSSSFDTLSYIKIGNWCYVMGNVQISSISGTLSGNYITFNSLPFTIASLTDASENGGCGGTVDSFGNSNGTVPMAVSWGGGGTNNFYVYRHTSDGNLITGATVGTGFRFAFGYRTA